MLTIFDHFLKTVIFLIICVNFMNDTIVKKISLFFRKTHLYPTLFLLGKVKEKWSIFIIRLRLKLDGIKKRSVRICVVREGGEREMVLREILPPVFCEGEDGWRENGGELLKPEKYLFSILLFYSILHYSFNHSAVHTLVLIQFNTYYIYLYNVHNNTIQFICLYIAQYTQFNTLLAQA